MMEQNVINQLEMKCQICDGVGEIQMDKPGIFSLIFANGKARCESCDGKGYNMTPEGKELLKFIMRHITTGIDGGGLRFKK